MLKILAHNEIEFDERVNESETHIGDCVQAEIILQITTHHNINVVVTYIIYLLILIYSLIYCRL